MQVLPVSGRYTPAKPIPGTVLVNIGDLMQRWTADKLVSTVSNATHSFFCPSLSLRIDQIM